MIGAGIITMKVLTGQVNNNIFKAFKDFIAKQIILRVLKGYCIKVNIKLNKITVILNEYKVLLEKKWKSLKDCISKK